MLVQGTMKKHKSTRVSDRTQTVHEREQPQLQLSKWNLCIANAGMVPLLETFTGIAKAFSETKLLTK